MEETKPIGGSRMGHFVLTGDTMMSELRYNLTCVNLPVYGLCGKTSDFVLTAYLLTVNQLLVRSYVDPSDPKRTWFVFRDFAACEQHKADLLSGRDAVSCTAFNRMFQKVKRIALNNTAVFCDERNSSDDKCDDRRLPEGASLRTCQSR